MQMIYFKRKKHPFIDNFLLGLALITLLGLPGCASHPHTESSSDLMAEPMKAIKGGQALFKRGCYLQALHLFFKANERFTALDDLEGTASSLNNIGNVYRITGKRKEALLLFQEAYQICILANNEDCSLQALANQSAVLIETNKLDQASEVLNQARDITNRSKRLSGPLLRNEGILHMKKQEFSQAEKLLFQALKVEKKDNISELAANRFALGLLMAETGRFSAALQHYQQALAYDRQYPFYQGIAADLAELGNVYMNLREYTLSAQHYQRSIKIYALLHRDESVNSLKPKLNQASRLASLDPTVTHFFIERWMAGQMTDDICP
jgi:tetratricopeptide (TPR) repeat protein